MSVYDFMVKRIVTIWCLILMVLPMMYGQNYMLTGVVKDTVTMEGIAGVNIWVPSQRTGTITNKNGEYTLVLPQPIDSVVFSCVGYNTQYMSVPARQKRLYVFMSESVIQLRNFDFAAGENPALGILREVHKHMNSHNPSKYSSYRCKIYTKSFFSSDIVNDSLTRAGLLDTLHRVSEQDLKLYAMLSKQHLFIMESVKERNYKQKDKVYEKILASKISGFKDPIFHVLTSEMQSFSCYDASFDVLTTPFENPLCDEHFKHYVFSLKETQYVNGDTLYVIDFKPIDNKQFRGVQGTVHINAADRAVQYIMLSPMYDGNMVNIILEQYYHKADSVWFPLQSKAKIVFNTAMVSVYPLVGYINTEYSDVEIGLPLKNSLFVGGELYVDTQNKRERNTESLLTQYRADSVSEKDLNTYMMWDTLSSELKLDKYLYVVESLTSGRLPVWCFDIEIPRIVSLNKHEACRVGIGLRTNDRLLKWMSIGGFFGYGFRDEEAKGGGDIDFKINRKWNSSIYVGVAYDLQEAGTGYESQFVHHFSYALRGLNKIPSTYYDNTLKYEIGASSLITNQVQLTIGASYQQNKACYRYNFSPVSSNADRYAYNMANIYVRMRISFVRRVYESDLFTLTERNNYPIVELAYQHGFKHVFGSGFAYNQYAVKVQQDINIPYIGTFSYMVRGGYIDRPLPLSALYAVHGNYMAFGLYDKTEFSTMKANEFLSDKFVSLHLSHMFNRLIQTRYCLLQPELLFNMAFGGLQHPEYHEYMEFKTMEKGYYELGAMVHKLLCVGFVGVGVGVYWRLGHYSLPRVSDNFSIRMSITVGRK